jgi:CRP-like cAMP-binding protein
VTDDRPRCDRATGDMSKIQINYVFGALEERDVEAVMRIGTQQKLHVGDQLLTEGSHHDAIYLVLDGELNVSVKGRNTAIAYVGKGEIVGEMSLLESQPASNTAVGKGAYALTDRGTWLSFGNKDDFKILVEGNPRLFNQYGVGCGSS